MIGATPLVAAEWEGVMETFFSGSYHLFAALLMKSTKVDGDGVSMIATMPDVFSHAAGGNFAHRGAYTIVLDTVIGFAAFAKLQMPKAITTINLKAEYLRPVEIGERIINTDTSNATALSRSD